MPEDESRLLVNGNPHLLKTAFQNIIENACKFSRMAVQKWCYDNL
jgi:signal transduction histidine kinase